MIITIDGPSASGKSSIAYALACDLNITYLNTGLLYRALAYGLHIEFEYLDEFNHPLHDHIDHILNGDHIQYAFSKETGCRVFYNKEDITSIIQKFPYDKWASCISADDYVRQQLLKMQRYIAHKHDIIADGRDCGTVVFPHAEYKFFLTASPTVRAQRWFSDQIKKGVALTLDQAKHIIQERDMRDSTRKYAPLQVPQTALVIDSTYLSKEEVIKIIKNSLAMYTV